MEKELIQYRRLRSATWQNNRKIEKDLEGSGFAQLRHYTPEFI
jgi:hypothetical protein